MSDVKVGDVVKDPALLRPGMRVRPMWTGRGDLDLEITKPYRGTAWDTIGDDDGWILPHDLVRANGVTVLAIPDQPAAGEVKGPRVGEWYRSAPGGELAQVTAIDDTQRFPVTVRWHKTTAYSDLTRGAFGPGEYFTGPVPGPDEGKRDHLAEYESVYKIPPAPPRCAPGCTPGEPCRTAEVCPVFAEEGVATFAHESMLPPWLRRSVALAEIGAAPPAPMRSGLGALACSLNVVKHGVKR